MTDVSPLQTSAPNRPRRTQAERRVETRSKILEAVVESIDEVGFQRTTAVEISRRSGVTWGAVQHHFGGKDGILSAVLEDSFDRFSSRLTTSIDPEAPLEQRVDVFVDRAWDHFSSAHYRSTFEILLHSTGTGSASDDASWQAEMLGAWKRVWRRIFPDVKLAGGRAVLLQHYAIAVLSGLASMQILAGEASRLTAMELAILKRTLVLEFEGPSSLTQTR